MTTAEKIEMYKRKKAFIDDLGKALRMHTCMAVTQVDYEVYQKTENDSDYFEEYLVVTFSGGAKSVSCVNGNSHIANYVEIGKLLYGGYYDEIPAYEALTEKGFFKINLEDN